MNKVVAYFDGASANALVTRRQVVNVAWDAPQFVSSDVDSSLRPRLALLSGNDMVLVWVRSDGAVMYALETGTGWSTPQAVPQAFAAGNVAVAGDRMTGDFGIAYRAPDGHLYAALNVAGLWQGPLQVDQSITGDPDITPGIGSATAELVYVKNALLQHVRFVGGALTAPASVGTPGVVDVTADSLPSWWPPSP